MHQYAYFMILIQSRFIFQMNIFISKLKEKFILNFQKWIRKHKRKWLKIKKRLLNSRVIGWMQFWRLVAESKNSHIEQIQWLPINWFLKILNQFINEVQIMIRMEIQTSRINNLFRSQKINSSLNRKKYQLKRNVYKWQQPVPRLLMFRFK